MTAAEIIQNDALSPAVKSQLLLSEWSRLPGYAILVEPDDEALLPTSHDVDHAYLSAAQTYALLAIADQLQTSGHGHSIADAVAFAGDMEP